MAPGVGYNIALPNNGTTSSEGTSMAAPHVTATVALLQQYANQQAAIPNPRILSGDQDRPEVMKAILLNSADKLNDVHGSQREIINKAGNNWTTTTASTSDFTSLDIEMGAGHLNANSALENFKPGEYSPGMVPPIGWDFDSIGAFALPKDYTINQEVSGWVAVTLAWNRLTEKTGDEDSYNSFDQFFNPSLTNLDLYLMDKDSNNVATAIGKSTTGADNLEHIFVQVPAGEYKIRVQGSINDADYGLAWGLEN